MKQSYFFLIMGLLSSGWLSAQEAIVVSGGGGSGGGGSTTYSIGQVTYTEISGSTGSVIQGVQQPYEIFVLGRDDHKNISLNISAYPNPTVSYLTLQINAEIKGLVYQLFDLNGRLLRNEKITAIETSIPMQTYNDAVYILKVYSNQSELKTFKIIKSNP